MSDNFVAFGIFVLIPTIFILAYYLYKKYESDSRTKIILSAIEKNPSIDVEQFVKSMAPREKPLRERLIGRIHIETLFGWTLCLTGFVGMVSMLAFGIYSIVIDMLRDGFFVGMMCFAPVFALGVGLLLAARQCKKALAKLQD